MQYLIRMFLEDTPHKLSVAYKYSDAQKLMQRESFVGYDVAIVDLVRHCM